MTANLWPGVALFVVVACGSTSPPPERAEQEATDDSAAAGDKPTMYKRVPPPPSDLESEDDGGVEGGVVGGVIGGVQGGHLGGQPPPPRKPTTRIVPHRALANLRVAGNSQIEPSPETRKRLARDGKRRLIAVVKICLSKDGRVASLKMLRNSDYPAYDNRIQQGMRTWRYKPFTLNGMPVEVCSAVTFVYTAPVPKPKANGP